jgi:hypothetical protein
MSTIRQSLVSPPTTASQRADRNAQRRFAACLCCGFASVLCRPRVRQSRRADNTRDSCAACLRTRPPNTTSYSLPSVKSLIVTNPACIKILTNVRAQIAARSRLPQAWYASVFASICDTACLLISAPISGLPLRCISFTPVFVHRRYKARGWSICQSFFACFALQIRHLLLFVLSSRCRFRISCPPKLANAS